MFQHCCLGYYYDVESLVTFFFPVDKYRYNDVYYLFIRRQWTFPVESPRIRKGKLPEADD